MPHVISFINLKGGVAKTTTAVQLADTFAFMHRKKVLVIDLDPQTNATLALIGEQRWEEADERSRTLAHLFLDLLNGTHFFDPQKAIVRGASNLNNIPVELLEQMPAELKYGRVDVLPSSIRLIDVQDRMQDISMRTNYRLSPMSVIERYIGPHFAGYDYVLIDCPPNLGFITQNGLEVSDHYLIPTIPDRMSTYGIPQIAGKIDELRRDRELSIRCLGVVVTKFQSNSSQHKAGLARLPAELEKAFKATAEDTPPILKTILPQTNASAEATTFEREVRNYPAKYGSGQVGGQAAYKYGLNLADEVEQLLERR